MKITLYLFALFLQLELLAQRKEAYYDYSWRVCNPENARYYSINQKTDSGWLRKDYYVSSLKLQMQALFEDEASKIYNGSYWFFYSNGKPSMTGRYVHNKQEGICMGYYSNGMMSDSALYHNGHIVDKRFQWHRNGYIADSLNRVNDSTEIEVGWFDDGSPAYAGYLLNGKNNGKWKYYHHNGQLSSSEIYREGKMISVNYFDENGNTLTDTSSVNREASFKGGLDAWRRYLEKNIYWPSNLQFTTPAAITIGVDFTIDENGKVIDAEVSLPFHTEFDKIALSIIKNSPPWIPGISHNRKVKAIRRQPITFVQPE